jgi:hypothetical protein
MLSHTSLICLCLWMALPALAAEPARNPLTSYFPPPESQGGWRTLLPDKGDPDTGQKERIRTIAGVDWDKLLEAWQLNQAVDGSTGLVVIRRGYVVGEWYKSCNREKTFNIYSSSKGYTSVAFGMLMADSKACELSGGKKLTLDTKVCNADWLPEALPLSATAPVDYDLRCGPRETGAGCTVRVGHGTRGRDAAGQTEG